MNAPLYTSGKEKSSTVTLDDAVFNVPAKKSVLSQVVVFQQAARRRVVSHTKNRGEVSGGGKKPWKQKGTGRARHGSIRSPLWRGGGITFGPRNNANFAISINKRVRRKATLMGLSMHAMRGSLMVVESLPQDGKVKTLLALLKTLPAAPSHLIIATPDHYESIVRASKNVSTINAELASNLNIVDLLSASQLVISQDALKLIESTYTEKEVA